MAQAPSLIRTKSVLHLENAGDVWAEFVQWDEDAEDERTPDPLRPTVRLHRETWDDMGQPEAITVAIWPGDRQDIMEGNLTWEADDSAEQVG